MKDTAACALLLRACSGKYFYCQVLYHLIRFEVEKAEEEFLKIQGTHEIQAYISFLLWIAIAITFENIIETTGQRHYLIVQYPLVGIENQFFGTEQTALVEISMKVLQHHMLGDDLADLRVAEVDAYLPANFGMMAPGFDAQGFGDIMEQCAGNCLVAVRQRAWAFPCSRQAIDQCSGNPGHED